MGRPSGGVSEGTLPGKARKPNHSVCGQVCAGLECNGTEATATSGEVRVPWDSTVPLYQRVFLRPYKVMSHPPRCGGYAARDPPRHLAGGEALPYIVLVTIYHMKVKHR